MAREAVVNISGDRAARLGILTEHNAMERVGSDIHNPIEGGGASTTFADALADALADDYADALGSGLRRSPARTCCRAANKLARGQQEQNVYSGPRITTGRKQGWTRIAVLNCQ
eukprot:GFKZ01003334.1.p2 GENE.GFKZ01003334.1~~GFKZ01003334.1.p2  ORF type:complete len:114 (+),score=12.27 GFKZ01003334.1:878-1219(+)